MAQSASYSSFDKLRIVKLTKKSLLRDTVRENTILLLELTLSHCENISDDGIRHLCSGELRLSLELIDLDNCPLLTGICLHSREIDKSLLKMPRFVFWKTVQTSASSSLSTVSASPRLESTGWNAKLLVSLSLSLANYTK